MSTATFATPGIENDARTHAEKRDDLHDRFLQADLADATRFADIPKDVVLCLLPNDDPVFVENELAAGAEAVRRGKNVYFRYVRVAELPAAPSDGARPQPGGRRTFFNQDGSIQRRDAMGADGSWRPLKPPQPVDAER